jgi:hypothetical protein
MVPFLSGWGHEKGCSLGGGGQGVPPQNLDPLSASFFYTLLRFFYIFCVLSYF